MEITACAATFLIVPMMVLFGLFVVNFKKVINFFVAPFRMLGQLVKRQKGFHFPRFVGGLVATAAVVLLVVFHPIKVVPCGKSKDVSTTQPAVDKNCNCPL